MSTAKNSFSLLVDDEGWSQPSKNKKKSKKKSAQPTEQAAAPVEQRQQDVNASDGAGDDFQTVKRNKTPKNSGSGPSAAENGRDRKPLDAASLENAVKNSKGNLSPLLKDWEARVRQEPSFRSELVKSQALERLVEGLASLSLAEDGQRLKSLLTAVSHPSAPAGLSKSVADLVATTGSLGPRDPLAPRSQAAAAGAAAVTIIKNGLPQKSANNSKSGGLAQLESVESRLASLTASLERAATTKEQVRVSTQLCEAAKDGADLGDVESGAAAFPEIAAALSSVESVRTALGSRHKVLTQGDKAGSVEDQISAAQRQHSREDAALAAQEQDADAQVAALEKQLAAARAAAQEIKARRAAAKQLLAQTVQGLQQGAAAVAANVKEIVSGLENALEYAGSVDKTLQSAVSAVASKEDSKALTQKWTEKGFAQQYASAVQRQLESSLKYLGELGSKATFYRERLEASSRQAEQLAALKDDAQLAEHKKQRKSLENLLTDALTTAASTEIAAKTAVEAWRKRQGRLRKQVGPGSLPLSIAQRIDNLAAEVATLADNIAAGKAIQAAAAPPKPPRASSSSGRTTPGSVSVPSASGPASEDASKSTSELTALEQRLAALEEENRKKDAQIAAMMAAASVDVPSPAPSKKKGGKK